MRVYGVILAGAVLMSACLCCDSFGLSPPLEAGTPAPAFTLTSTDGETVALADFAGQVVLLNFWSSG